MKVTAKVENYGKKPRLANKVGKNQGSPQSWQEGFAISIPHSHWP